MIKCTKAFDFSRYLNMLNAFHGTIHFKLIKIKDSDLYKNEEPDSIHIYKCMYMK